MAKSTSDKTSKKSKDSAHCLTPSQKTINKILLFAASVQVEKITDGEWLQFFLN